MKINYDDGVNFGLAVFETILIRDYKPVLLEYHMERMEKSLEYFKIRNKITETEILSYIKENCEGYSQEFVLKIYISNENKIFSTRKNNYTKEDYRRGFSLCYSDIIRNSTSPFVYNKTANYGECILEKRNAVAKGYDDSLFCNEKGEVCECATSNIFFVSDKKIYTPHLNCGILPGTIRRMIMEKNDVKEVHLFPKDIEEMEGAFVTNSIMGIMPITQIQDRFYERDAVKNLIQIKWDE